MTLLRSQIQCPKCGDIIASIHVHDFQTCICGQTMLDGGRDYLRIAGDAIVSAAQAAGSVQEWDRSIHVAGDHNKASSSAALEVYKALWEGSLGGKKAISGAEVHRSVVERSIRLNIDHKLTVRAVRAYLSALADGENACVEAVGARWRPKIPLAERRDAP